MESANVGQVVFALRGRDSGKFMCVVGTTDSRWLLCDGKERRIEHPKRKNPKHVQKTAMTLTAVQMRSNRAIQKALKFISEA